MTAPKTPDLDGIQARADAATEGPWERTIGDDGRVYISCPPPVDVHVAQTDLSGIDFALTDADFIAAARTDVPLLVTRIRQLEAIEEAIIKMRDDYAAAIEKNGDTSYVPAQFVADELTIRLRGFVG